MNIYVAGKTHDFPKVREVQQCVRAHGHTITHDWTTSVELHGPDHQGEPLTFPEAEMIAEQDVDGVREADLVIVIPHERLTGTLIEIGIAVGLGIDVVFLGPPHPRSVFWAHPRVRMLWFEWPTCKPELQALLMVQSPSKLKRVPVDGRQ